MNTKKCKVCGSELDEKAKYCGACGEMFSDEAASSDASESEGEGQQSYEYTKDSTQNQNSSFSNASSNTDGPGDNQGTGNTKAEPVRKGDPGDVESVKIILIIAYIFQILFFLPLVSNPKSEFGRYHANQILLVLLTDVVLGILGIITCGVAAPLAILGIVLAILGIINVCNGEMKPLPLIGGIVLIK